MLYGMNNQLEDLMERAEEAKKEKNRAAIATANAEIRRGKNYLREELPKLRKLMSKKSKGVTDEMRAEREQEVADFEYKIECVPDGVTKAPPPPPPRLSEGGGGAARHVTLDMASMAENPTFNMEHTEESRAFNKEFEKSKKIQDEGLDEISKGLRVLKNLGGEMDEEIKRQEPIMDTIDTNMDTVTAEMRTANGRLKSIITSMRSTRHFCIDVTLIFIILGVALYLANSFG